LPCVPFSFAAERGKMNLTFIMWSFLPERNVPP
jgi:hypothetical protein